MQARRHGLQLMVALMTLTVTEPYGAAELLSLNSISGAPDDVVSSPQDNAARIGLRSLSNLVTDKNAAILGFKNTGEMSEAQLGAPLTVYIVNLEDLRSFDPASSTVTDLLKPMATLIYPLLTKRQEDENGKLKARSALVVSQRKDKVDKTKVTWTPTNWGLKPLAQAITEYRDRVEGFASGFVVWVPALNLHFLGDQVTENLMLIPLATRQAYGLTRGVPISAKIVFALYAREAKSLDENNPG